MAGKTASSGESFLTARRSGPVRWAVRLWLCAIGITAGWSGPSSMAQDAATPTLHVYTDLMQIPVLVLGPDRQPIKPIDAGRFRISIDDGPLFRATHVRREGDDPISLMILVDVNAPQKEMLQKLDGAIGKLGPPFLDVRDHVSIYALDCSLMQTLNDEPADPAGMQRAMEAALKPWKDRGQDKHGRGCEQQVHLWDALAQLTEQMSHLPGRRVILALTDGSDRGSQHTWKEVKGLARDSVVIFGMAYAPASLSAPTLSTMSHLPPPAPVAHRSSEDPFNSLCELTGGMLFWSGDDVKQKLQWFMTIVRGRYIVEFPQPYKATAGHHVLDVTIEGINTFIRSAGMYAAIDDPSVLDDPMTVPSDPSRHPQEGKRKVLTVPQ